MKDTNHILIEKEFQCLANKFCQFLRPPSVVFLEGPLGSGKTTFVRYLLRALGCKSNVVSPTYTFLEEYETDASMIYHLDLYRIENVDEVENLGLRDLLSYNNLIFIEWPRRGGDAVPNPDWIVEIDYASKGRNVLIYNSSGTCLHMNENNENNL